MNRDKFSILICTSDSNLRLAVWRDRDLPQEANPDEWSVAAT